MEEVIIKGSTNTFQVKFNKESGILEIQGRSTVENPVNKYHPLLEAIEKYAEQPQKFTILNIEVDYINSSSSRYLMNIFKKLETIHEDGTSKVTVNWFYEEDDEVIYGLGKDFQGIVDLSFNLVEIN